MDKFCDRKFAIAAAKNDDDSTTVYMYHPLFLS